MANWKIYFHSDKHVLAKTSITSLTLPLLQYRAWNTTMDKPIHEREHNDCQQLITKSHGRSWLDSNIQPQEESNAYLSVKGRVTVNV